MGRASLNDSVREEQRGTRRARHQESRNDQVSQGTGTLAGGKCLGGYVSGIRECKEMVR